MSVPETSPGRPAGRAVGWPHSPGLSSGMTLVSEIPATEPLKGPVEETLRDVLGRLPGSWSARILLSRSGRRWLFVLTRGPDGLGRTLSFEPSDHAPEVVRMALLAALADVRERRRRHLGPPPGGLERRSCTPPR